MSEWKALTLGQLSIQRKGINYKSEDYGDEHSGHPFITIKCFVKGGGYESTGIKFYDGVTTKADHLSPGDLLFSLTDLTRAGDIVGSPLRVPDFGGARPALASMDCMRIEPIANRCDKRFLYHRLMLADVRRQMVAYAAGSTVLHLDTKKVPSICVRIPVDVNLQSRIADVLDCIEAAIKKTEALIAKYQQIKAGLMHDLFSRGVLPSGQLRPPREQAPELYQKTAIGWIPSEWHVSPLRACLLGNPTNGIYKSADQIGVEGTLMVGQTAFTVERSVDFSLCRRGAVSPVEIRQYGLSDGDILMTRVFATIEGVGLPTLVPVAPEPAVYESNMMRLQVNTRMVVPRLLFEWLRSPAARSHISARVNASNQCSVNQSAVNPLPVPLPGADEQNRLNLRIENIDKTLAAEISLLVKLQRQKLGLMNDLLTGKLPLNVDGMEAVHA